MDSVLEIVREHQWVARDVVLPAVLAPPYGPWPALPGICDQNRRRELPLESVRYGERHYMQWLAARRHRLPTSPGIRFRGRVQHRRLFFGRVHPSPQPALQRAAEVVVEVRNDAMQRYVRGHLQNRGVHGHERRLRQDDRGLEPIESVSESGV